MAGRRLTETLMAVELVEKGKHPLEAARLCGVHIATVYRALANKKIASDASKTQEYCKVEQ